jgi:hypothetical protein
MLFLVFIKVFPSMSIAETMQGAHAATLPAPAEDAADAHGHAATEAGHA